MKQVTAALLISYPHDLKIFCHLSQLSSLSIQQSWYISQYCSSHNYISVIKSYIHALLFKCLNAKIFSLDILNYTTCNYNILAKWQLVFIMVCWDTYFLFMDEYSAISQQGQPPGDHRPILFSLIMKIIEKFSIHTYHFKSISKSQHLLQKCNRSSIPCPHHQPTLPGI